MKRKFLLLVFLLGTLALQAQPITYAFADRDSCTLLMDIYMPDTQKVTLQPQTILYVFGGGFIMGQRNGSFEIPYFQELNRRGYRVVAIDYRLGLKGVTKVGPTHVKPLENAINMAVEDLFDAVYFLKENQALTGVDASQLVLVGSSAGAITCLEADYQLSRRMLAAKKMSDDFRFAGVVAYSGAIFTREGKPDYTYHAPAPTCFFHGTADRLVVYDRIKVFNIGFFGGNALTRIFEKNAYPYMTVRYVGMGHEVAARPLEDIDKMLWFIRHYVAGKESLRVDILYNNPAAISPDYGRMTADDLYNKKKD